MSIKGFTDMKLKYFVLLIILTYSAKAQFIEDALRYTKQNGMITPRTASMGVAYNGLVDDVGALLYNPAGLTLIQKSELSFGLGFVRNSAETSFMNVNDLFKSNNEFINHAAVVSGFVIDGKKTSIGIGYFREGDFYNNLQFSSLNNNSTMIASEAKYGPRDDKQNWAYDMFLASKNGNNFITPLTDSLQQTGRISEKGGLHSVVGGISFDINENVSIGGSIIGKWGNYTYVRDYSESDILGLYSNTPIDGYQFSKLDLKEDLTQKVSGISGSIGVVGKYENILRFSANIKFPTWYQFDESFYKRFDVSYLNNNANYFTYGGNATYNLTTPFVYSAGVSINNMGLTFSAGVEYSDVSQLQFSDANSNVIDLNSDIIRELVGQTTWGFGLEYDPGFIPFVGRISYSRTTSPYIQDISNANKSNFAMGIGVYLGEKVRIDGVFRWTEFSEIRTNYKDANSIASYSRYLLKNQPLTLGFGITYRY